MRALTLRHPWSFAVVHLSKTVENRDWNDEYAAFAGLCDLIGERIAIHGGKAPKRGNNQAWRELSSDAAALAQIVRGDAATRRAFRAHFGERPNTPLLEGLILPGVVAVATLADVTFTSRSIWAVPGQRQLLLADVITLPEPVPCRGGRGFWELETETEAEVQRQVRGADALRVPVSRTAEEWLA